MWWWLQPPHAKRTRRGRGDLPPWSLRVELVSAWCELVSVLGGGMPEVFCFRRWLPMCISMSIIIYHKHIVQALSSALLGS